MFNSESNQICGSILAFTKSNCEWVAQELANVEEKDIKLNSSDLTAS